MVQGEMIVNSDIHHSRRKVKHLATALGKVFVQFPALVTIAKMQ